MENTYNDDYIGDAHDNSNAMEIDETIPIYTNYYKHSNGHIDFHELFIKKFFWA